MFFYQPFLCSLCLSFLSITTESRCCFKIYKSQLRSILEYYTQDWALLARQENWNVILRLEGKQRRVFLRRCPWCNGYRRRNWTRQHEFKSWTRLIVFHKALIPLGKVWIQLFSLQLWANWILQTWWGNQSRRRNTLNSNLLNSA